MNRSMHVWIDAPRGEHGARVYAARLERAGSPARELWFRVPEEFAGRVTQRADPFAILSVFTAMKGRVPVTIHGEVSPSLLRNVDEFQAAWAAWRPETYAHVEIGADVEREDPSPAPADRAVVAFSGGIDAAFSALRHHDRRCGRRSRTLGAAVMIHGYDVPAQDAITFGHAYRRAGAMTESLGLPLIPVTTNYREIEPGWEDVHGACVVASLALFAREFGTGILGSSEPYVKLVLPWASNPVTDPLLASASFGVVHDGAEFDRNDKIRALSGWKEAMENVLVCWEPTPEGRNCGRCVKCIRTILNFRVLGLPRPAAFPRDVEVGDILGIRMSVLNETMVNEFEVILRAAAAANIADPWVAPLRHLLSRLRLRTRIGRLQPVARLRGALQATAAGRRVWHVVRKR